MSSKIYKLNINPSETGINIDVDGAPEGIHVEYEILPAFIETLVDEALAFGREH